MFFLHHIVKYTPTFFASYISRANSLPLLIFSLFPTIFVVYYQHKYLSYFPRFLWPITSTNIIVCSYHSDTAYSMHVSQQYSI